MPQPAYSSIRFTRRGSVVDVLPNQLVPDRLTNEMALLGLRQLNLLLRKHTLNSPIHPDRLLHHLTRGLASQLLEPIKVFEDSRIPWAGVKPLVDRELLRIAHTQSQPLRRLNRGGPGQ